MRDYRVPKKQGGFNLQKLYTDILKSPKQERWLVERLMDKAIIASYRALYIVPGRFPLTDDLISKACLRYLIPDWDDGVPCVCANPEVPLTDKTKASVFRKDEEDFYFNKDLFKYFTTDAFEYRLSGNGRHLYIAYKGELIAVLFGINVSKQRRKRIERTNKH